MLITRSNYVHTTHRSLLSASVIVLAGAAWLVLWTTGGSAHGSMHDHHAAMATSSAAPLLDGLVRRELDRHDDRNDAAD